MTKPCRGDCRLRGSHLSLVDNLLTCTDRCDLELFDAPLADDDPDVVP